MQARHVEPEVEAVIDSNMHNKNMCEHANMTQAKQRPPGFAVLHC